MAKCKCSGGCAAKAKTQVELLEEENKDFRTLIKLMVKHAKWHLTEADHVSMTEIYLKYFDEEK